MRAKAFVLISGGVDSTTALAIASLQFKDVQGVSIDYGQRHRKEIDYAKRQCTLFGAEHHVLPIGDVLKGVMLTDRTHAIPDVKYNEIDGVSPTYVPFRNGTLLSVIAAHAQKWVDVARKNMTLADVANANRDLPPSTKLVDVIGKRDVGPKAAIFFGAHAEDALNWAYPDCTPEFIGAMGNAIFIGTYQAVRLHAPLMWMMKHEIVRLGHELGVDFSQTWSCYAGGVDHCGKCPTCYARQDAFEKAGVPDPTVYAVPRKAT